MVHINYQRSLVNKNATLDTIFKSMISMLLNISQTSKIIKGVRGSIENTEYIFIVT